MTDKKYILRPFEGGKNFAKENRFIIIIMILLFTQRFAALYELGVSYSLNSDDLSYIKSGIYFAKTGIITMHNQYPSAQIMPGMTVFIGALSLIFGEGNLLLFVLRVLWIAMGSLTAWFIYKSVTVFTPKWCGLVATLPLFRADFVWMDNIILTETPFVLFLTATIYYTFKMGKDNNYKNFWGCAVFYMLALMLKANIAPYPLFALIYLMIVKYDKKLLIKQCIILSGVVLCFVIPWSVRNYINFKSFIPLTYGAGNPTLLGTYQGINYPADENLDYTSNVEQVIKEKYSKYYDKNGNIIPKYEKYIALKKDGLKADYRKSVWEKTDLKSMIYSYVIIKPRDMIASVFYWKEVFNIDYNFLQYLSYFEIAFCVFSVAASLVLKKYRAPIIYASAVYITNILIYSMTFSFDRYNASLISLRHIVLGLGVSLFLQSISKGIISIEKYHKYYDEEIKNNL